MSILSRRDYHVTLLAQAMWEAVWASRKALLAELGMSQEDG